MTLHKQKHFAWVTFGLLALGCGGGAATTGRNGQTANPARTAGGDVVRSGGTGQAVSSTANTRFEEAARQLRAHDEAAAGVGDWAAGTCNDVANAFEAAANAQPGGAFPEAWVDRGLALDRCATRLPAAEGAPFRERARQAFQHAIDVAQNHRFCRAQVQLGVYQYRDNQVEQALATFRQAATDDRTCVEAFTNTAMILRERNQGTDRQDAVNAIRSALARDDRFIPALNQLALTYLQEAADARSQRLMLASIVCLQAVQVTGARAADMSPDVRSYVADVYNTWGLVDIRSGQIIRALEHFRRAYQLNPNMFQAWVNYGTINLSFRGYADARDAFQHAVALRGTDYDSHIGLGVALRGLSQFQEALAEYNRAHDLDPNRPDAYYNLGLLYESYMGGEVADLQRAQGYLQEFLTKAGNDARFAEAVTRANHHVTNIRDSINALNAAAQLNAASAQFAASQADGGAAAPAPPGPPAPAAPPAPPAPAPAAPPAAPPAAGH